MNRHRLILLALLVGACTQQKPRAKTKEKTAPKKRIETLVADSNAIDIRLGTGDQVFIEGTITELNTLASRLRSAYHQKGDTATVIIQVLGNTPFGTYAETQRVLEELLYAQRDSVALLRFEKHYEDLEPAQQRDINQTYHLRILERIKR